jgi:hypothetical protein
MSSSKKTVVLVVIPFLLVMLICSLVSKPVVFADVKKGPIGCTPNKNPGNVAKPGLITCCQTTTDSEGIETTKCTVCDDTQPPSNCTKPFTPREGSGPPSNAGTVQPPSTPPPPSNAIPPPSVLPSPTKQQTLTTTCPNGLLPDANGNCPTSTTTTNQRGGLTSNDNNNPTSEHHKGSNQPTQTGGGGQELTATKKHKGSKTDQGTTQPP